MTSGLFKPLSNTPVVRNPNDSPTPETSSDDRSEHSDEALGTDARTSVTPTTTVPDSKEPGEKHDA